MIDPKVHSSSSTTTINCYVGGVTGYECGNKSATFPWRWATSLVLMLIVEYEEQIQLTLPTRVPDIDNLFLGGLSKRDMAYNLSMGVHPPPTNSRPKIFTRHHGGVIKIQELERFSLKSNM
jgi:hypothetical protein